MFNGKSTLMFDAALMRKYRADDGLKGVHGAPAKLVLTQGIGPDWPLHVMLLRSFLGTLPKAALPRAAKAKQQLNTIPRKTRYHFG